MHDRLSHARSVLRSLACCYACGATDGPFHQHHVVPRSLLANDGTVPLCGACHAKVHDREMLELQRLAKPARDAKQAAGEYACGRPPFGWTPRRRKGRRELVEHPGEQAIIAEVRRLRAVMPLEDVMNEVQARGYKGKFGGPLSRSLVLRLTEDVHGPHYVTKEELERRPFMYPPGARVFYKTSGKPSATAAILRRIKAMQAGPLPVGISD